jgi:peptide chain release factor subunit 1
LNVKFVNEKKLISKFFEEIAQDTGMIVFGVEDTMRTLEAGALDTLMIYEDIDITRYVIKHPVKGDTHTYFLNPNQEKDSKYFRDQESNLDLEVVSSDSLAEWLCHHYTEFGITVEFITDKS